MYSTWCLRPQGRLIIISNYICQTTNTINYIFFLFFVCAISWSWQSLSFRAGGLFINLENLTCMYSFSVCTMQGKMGMVCRTFTILTLPCYLILNNKMFDLKGKDMFQRGVNHDWHCFWCTSYLLLWCCPNGRVLCKVVL